MENKVNVENTLMSLFHCFTLSSNVAFSEILSSTLVCFCLSDWSRGSRLFKPKFHLLRHVTTRHDTTSTTCHASRDVTCRACSNMADDEEAVVLACKTTSCFIIVYYFSSQMKLIRSMKRITAIITLYTLQTNRVAYRACRARRNEPVAYAKLVVTSSVALAVEHIDFFLCQNAWAR